MCSALLEARAGAFTFGESTMMPMCAERRFSLKNLLPGGVSFLPRGSFGITVR
jgi:hypothetical protein